MRALLLAGLLFALLFAGCLGGDDDDVDTPEQDDGPRFTAETGSVWGRVIDEALDAVAGATVTLAAGAEAIQEVVSKENGQYALNDVPPGAYRIQVTSFCCHQAVVNVQVVAGQDLEQDFMLTRFEEMELRIPHVDGPHEAEGFIACALIVPGAPGVQCNQDPSHVIQIDLNVDKGVKTVTAGLLWEPSGVSPAQELQFFVEKAVAGSHEIGYASGAGPLEVRVDAADVADSANTEFSEEDGWQLRLRVRPVEGFVWQQRVTFWYTVHYWDPAPAGYSTIPDM